jgi:ABC-type sugar transport system permease subunit
LNGSGVHAGAHDRRIRDAAGPFLVLSVLSLVVSLVVGVGAVLMARANLQRQIQVAAREAWMREFREQVAALLTSFAAIEDDMKDFLSERGRDEKRHAEIESAWVRGHHLIRLLIAEKGTQYAAFVQIMNDMYQGALSKHGGPEAPGREQAFYTAAEDILRRERLAIEGTCGRERERRIGAGRRRMITNRTLNPVLPWQVHVVGEVFPNVVVALILAILLFSAVKHSDWIISHFSGGWLFGTILIACVVLFYVRRFFRLGYGMLEVLLGLGIVADTIIGPLPAPSSADEPIIKIAAGMYLAIRGIDNCMNWLTPRLADAPAWVRRILRSE